MALRLETPLAPGDSLLTLSELGRILDFPESKLNRAIEAGVVKPLGYLGRNLVVVLRPGDRDTLRDRILDALRVAPILPRNPLRRPWPTPAFPETDILPAL